MSFGWSFDERAVDEDVTDPALPELPHEDLEVVDETHAPGGIPVRQRFARSDHEQRRAELRQRELPGREQPVDGEWR